MVTRLFRPLVRRRFETAAPAAIVGGVYLIAAAWTITGYRWQINPDGVAYFSVAERWFAGDGYNAINGYWSPLFSWLLIPLLAIGVPSLLAARVLQVVAGALTFWSCDILLRRFDVQRSLRLWAALALIPVTLSFGMTLTTPDVLVTAVLLAYLAWQMRVPAPLGWTPGFISGLLVGAAYLTKAYALPFAATHLLIVHALDMRAPDRRRAVITTVVAAALGAAVLAGPWIGLVWWKYGRVIVADSGRYSWQLVGPGRPEQPMAAAGLLAPPHEHAYSVWDDPTKVAVADWHPLRSQQSLIHFGEHLQSNAVLLWREMVRAVPFFSLWIACGAVISWQRLKRPEHARPMLSLIVAAFLYPIGYWITLVEIRFSILLIVLSLVVAMLAVQQVSRFALFRGPLRSSMLAALVATTFAWWPIAKLHEGWHADKYYNDLAHTWRDVLPPGARVASVENWHATLFLSYHLDLRYFGMRGPRQSDESFQRQLDEMRVAYVMQWSGASSAAPPTETATRVATRLGTTVWRLPAANNPD